jgi:death-on-curing protein
VEIRYLTVGDVIALHDYIMSRLGSAPSVMRDEGGLESALMRPRQAAFYEDADLIRQAILMSIGIAQAQAFVDGNKRTTYQCLDAFLWTNGVELTGDPMELADWLVSVAERSDELDSATSNFERWLRENVTARKLEDR